jgi:hypothetical protein
LVNGIDRQGCLSSNDIEYNMRQRWTTKATALTGKDACPPTA